MSIKACYSFQTWHAPVSISNLYHAHLSIMSCDLLDALTKCSMSKKYINIFINCISKAMHNIPKWKSYFIAFVCLTVENEGENAVSSLNV